MATRKALAALQAKWQKDKLRKRRRRHLGVGLLLLLLILLLWQCPDEHPAAPGENVQPQVQEIDAPVEVDRHKRPTFARQGMKHLAWGAELHRQLSAYSSPIRNCLQKAEIKGVRWIFRFEAAKGLLRHVAFQDAKSASDDAALGAGERVENCLLEVLPQQIKMAQIYPAGWTEVQLILDDSLEP